MNLRLIRSRAHDLPPLWDGYRVQWSPWRDEPHTSMVFHAPAHEFACTGCGWIPDTQLRTTGRVWPPEGVIPSHPVARLAVLRCTGCGLDEVTDLHTGELWDLEPDDYTDVGSWPEGKRPGPVQDTLF